MSTDDVETWRRRVRGEAEQTIALLEKHEQGRLVPADAILARIAACPAPKHPTHKTRHHGDYHLGQVLISNNDFVIIDFEGEPSRPLAEARRKHTPLRDVAGMLRSFSYARASAVMRAEAKGDALERWESETRRAFLAAYQSAMQGGGLFASFDDVRGLLDLAEIEKLLYEIRYELNNRPAWLHIPLGGLTALLGKGGT